MQLGRTRFAVFAFALTTASCAEQFVIEAVPVPMGCPDGFPATQSIAVELARGRRDGEEPALTFRECVDTSAIAPQNPLEALRVFRDRGYVIRRVAVDSNVRVRLVGASEAGCPAPADVDPTFCALSTTALDESLTDPEDILLLQFACIARDAVQCLTFGMGE